MRYLAALRPDETLKRLEDAARIRTREGLGAPTAVQARRLRPLEPSIHVSAAKLPIGPATGRGSRHREAVGTKRWEQCVVRSLGLEPRRLSTPGFEAGAATDFAKSALRWSSRVGSDHRPSPCHGVALPLSYARNAGWCPRRESNPHAFRLQLLRLVCLPIPPPGHGLRGPSARGQREVVVRRQGLEP